MPRERSAFWSRRPLRFEALESRRLLSVFSLDTDADLPGVGSSSVAWGDYDNDGDLDILLTGYSTSGSIARVYRNDGGSFTDISAGLPGVRWASVQRPVGHAESRMNLFQVSAESVYND